MRQEEYLQILTEQIRSKKARGTVLEEIKGHIEEQKIEFMNEGMKRVRRRKKRQSEKWETR